MARRPRLLFYAHDNRGLGHLMRLSRVAAALHLNFSCLFITGSGEASWIVPAGCKYIYIPSLDKRLHEADSLHRGVAIEHDTAIRLRSQLIAAMVRNFAPDAFIIDHLAAGRRGELAETLASSPARKYLLLRGVIDDPAKAKSEVFPVSTLHLIDAAFSRVLIASDRNISRVHDEYFADEPGRVRSLLRYVGYVSPTYTLQERQAVRTRFGVGRKQTWVVCSAGGGRESAEFVSQCIELAHLFPNVAFEIIRGPRAICPDSDRKLQTMANLRVWPASLCLPLLHAAADVVICRGGYNTLMEVAAGTAHAICVPLELEDDREQHIHASRLAQHIPIQISSGQRDDLVSRLRSLLDLRTSRHSPESWRERSTLDFDGVTKICQFIAEDFSA